MAAVSCKPWGQLRSNLNVPIPDDGVDDRDAIQATITEAAAGGMDVWVPVGDPLDDKRTRFTKAEPTDVSAALHPQAGLSPGGAPSEKRQVPITAHPILLSKQRWH